MASDGKLIFDTELNTKGVETGLSKIKNIASGIGAGIGTGLVAGATALTALAKTAVTAYADYEQLTGGVETLFKESSAQVMKYANAAYMTAGMSANQYMETVTSFSASLLQSLGGDTGKAAEKANKAIVDMSDNANKMGTSMESIQNAYQGFAKGQFNMLDNLKLGYGGTQEEMKRLLADAQAISGVQYNISSYADIVDAIHVIQENMGIAGTTAKEAESTISGSLNMVKASWENLMGSLADPKADIGELIGNLSYSISKFASNIVPAILQAVKGAGTLIEQLVPVFVDMIPKLFQQILPALLENASNVVYSLLDALPSLLQSIFNSLPGIITSLVGTVIPKLFMKIVETVIASLPIILDGIIQIVLAIAQALPDLIQTICDELPALITIIIDALLMCLPQLIDGCVQLVIELVANLPTIILALIQAIPGVIVAIIEALWNIIPKVLELCEECWKGIKDSWNGFKNFWADCAEEIKARFENIDEWFKEKFEVAYQNVTEIFGQLGEFFRNVWQEIKDAFSEVWKFFFNLGKNVVNSIIEGVKAMWEDFKGFWEFAIDDWTGSIKAFLGISSPSKEFEEIGGYCVAGFEKGTDNMFDGNTIAQNINSGLSSIQANVDTLSYGSQASAQPIVLENNVHLEGDAKGVFKLVQRENKTMIKSTGYHALA